MRDKKQRKGRKEATIVTLVRKDWFFLPQVHSKKTTSFQEIIILTHLFFLGVLVESESGRSTTCHYTHKSESDHCWILNTINAANCKTQLDWWKWKYMSRAILCLDEIIVMIVTAPILMAKGVASNSILVTLAPLCLALGLTWAFEKSLPTSVALKANSRSHANGDIFRNAPPFQQESTFLWQHSRAKK